MMSAVSMTAAGAYTPPPNRRARAMSAARRRTRFIGLLRIGLIAALIAVAGHAVMRIVIADTRDGPEALAPAGDSERILNARYTGRDTDGQPFVITSDAAARLGGAIGGQALLDNPRLDYALLLSAGADASEALAESGTYDEATRTLHLDSSVRLTTASGYVFRSERASVDLAGARIFGDDRVLGSGPWGQVQANAFSVEDRGERLVFRNGVVTRFYLDD